jgi:hypothetical protein
VKLVAADRRRIEARELARDAALCCAVCVRFNKPLHVAAGSLVLLHRSAEQRADGNGVFAAVSPGRYRFSSSESSLTSPLKVRVSMLR